MTTPLREVVGSEISSNLSALIFTLSERLLSGDEPQHETLRRQLRSARLARVELTGAGLYAYFAHPSETPTVEPAAMIGGDVPMQVTGLDAPAGCLIAINGGRIDFLEIYTFGDVGWPDEPGAVSLGPATPVPIPRKAT